MSAGRTRISIRRGNISRDRLKQSPNPKLQRSPSMKKRKRRRNILLISAEVRPRHPTRSGRKWIRKIRRRKKTRRIRRKRNQLRAASRNYSRQARANSQMIVLCIRRASNCNSVSRRSMMVDCLTWTKHQIKDARVKIFR